MITTPAFESFPQFLIARFIDEVSNWKSRSPEVQKSRSPEVQKSRSPEVIIILYFCCILLYTAWGGTTIVAKCRDGIVLASDSMHTIQNSPLLSAPSMRKFYLLTSAVTIGYVSGGWQFHKLYRDLQSVVREHQDEELSITAIKHYARNLVNTKYPFAHLIIAGYDANEHCKENGYRLFEILPQGTAVEQDYIVCGSGGDLLVPLLENEYKLSMPSQSKDEVISKKLCVDSMLKVCRNALQSVNQIDPRTGGSRLSLWVMKEKP
ncbi:hypothetical protein EON65_46825 [archaeon]|nr:MAG: hypothetical protein EON65_46825 [archaeon]